MFFFLCKREIQLTKENTLSFRKFTQDNFINIIHEKLISIESCTFSNIRTNDYLLQIQTENTFEINQSAFLQIYGGIYMNKNSKSELNSKLVVSDSIADSKDMFITTSSHSYNQFISSTLSNCSVSSGTNNFFLIHHFIRKSKPYDLNITNNKDTQLMYISTKKLPTFRCSVIIHNIAPEIPYLLQFKSVELKRLVFDGNSANIALIHTIRPSIVKDTIFKTNDAKGIIQSDHESVYIKCTYGNLPLHPFQNPNDDKKNNNFKRSLLAGKDPKSVQWRIVDFCSLALSGFVLIVFIVYCASCCKKKNIQIHGEITSDTSANAHSDDVSYSTKETRPKNDETTDDSYLRYDSNGAGIKYDTQETSPTSANGGKYCSFPDFDRTRNQSISETSKYNRSELDFTSNQN